MPEEISQREKAKLEAAGKALDVLRQDGYLRGVVGFGAGTTLEALIGLMRREGALPAAAAAASVRTWQMLAACGVRVLPSAAVGELPVYVDGADWVDPSRALIKGGGGQMTGEKILATAAKRFLCMADEGKLVESLAGKPVPVEALGAAAGLVEAWAADQGLRLRWRPGVLGKSGGPVGDLEGLDVADPWRAEGRLREVPGLMESGIFARRRPDEVLVGALS